MADNLEMDLTSSSSSQSSEFVTANNMPEASSVETHNEQTAATTKLTPEQEEEMKLRSKYPNPQKPGGSTFIQKMLHRGSKKYFDSGDYNMAKSRTKQALNNNNNNNSNNINVANNSTNQNNNGRVVAQQKISEESSNSPSSNVNSPNVNPEMPAQSQSNNGQASHIDDSVNQSPYSNPNNNNSNLSTNSSNTSMTKPTAEPTILIQTPTMLSHAHNADARCHYHPNVNSANQSPNVMMSPVTSQNSNSINHTHHYNNTNTNTNNMLSSSTSSSSINMISSSLSSDRLSNIQLNPDSLLNSEEIGHGIPTPECLPQSRKHSIAQSKLATPRLSTSQT